MKDLRVYVLGHTDEMLASVPRADHLVPVDLRALTVPDEFDSNQYAEGRFLLSAEARRASAEYIGVVSANWPARFPDRLGLPDLTAVRPFLAPHRVFTPVPGLAWRERGESRHPGMRAIVDDLAGHLGVTPHGPVPYANTFVCHRSLFTGLLDFWDESFDYLHAKYGLDYPFTYRCVGCGLETEDGFGRYRNDRHAGYVGEHVTMLYFGSRPGLAVWRPPSRRTGSWSNDLTRWALWYSRYRLRPAGRRGALHQAVA